MSDHVYKTIEVTGSSPEGHDEAIRRGIEKAGRTVRKMRWFQVIETRGHIEENNIAHWQVTLKIGFALDD